MNWLKNIFITIRDSFYNPRVYREAAGAGFSRGFYYALISGASTALVAALFIIPGLMEFSKTDFFSNEAIERAYPEGLEITIRNGEVSTNAKEPLQLRADEVFPPEDGDTGSGEESDEPEYFLTIDTTHELTIEEVRAYNSAIVLGRNTLYGMQNGRDIRAFDLSQIEEDVVITEATIVALAEKARPWIKAGLFVLPIFVFLLLTAVIAIFYLLCALAGSLAVKLIAWMRGFHMPFGGAYIVALLALIPVAIFDVVIGFLGVGNVFSLGVAVFVVVVILNVQAEESDSHE